MVWSVDSVIAFLIVVVLTLVASIVERKRVEEALRESEAQYRLLFESSPESITLIGLDGTILDCNDTTVALSGLPKREMLDHSFMDINGLPEEDLPRYLNILSGLLDEEQTPSLEVEITRGDENRWLEIYPSLLRKDGQVYAVQVIARDTTERKRAEAELIRLQHLLQNIADSMPSALITLDPEGRVLTWNPAAETLTGQAADQVIGRSLWQACPEMSRSSPQRN